MNSKKEKSRTIQRRDFIRKGALTLGALTILPNSVLFAKKAIYDARGSLVHPGSVTPGEKINMAFCGIGNRGGDILRTFMNTGMVNNVAMCDTDMGAPQTLENMNTYSKVPKFKDFRKMFDKMANDIDAVCIGTPDFSHFPITMLAMSLGKHVYVEKPLSRTFQESELMMDAAARYGVVTQMGNQGHSGANYFQFKSWVEHGIIKDVTKVVAHMNNPRRWHGWDTSITAFPKGQPVPDTLDWDTWLGTSQYHNYHKDFVNGQWRCWYDFGMGALGDWGAHILDSAHQFLDLGLPEEIDPIYLKGHNDFFYPQSTTLDFKFPARKGMPALTVTWQDGLDNQPVLPEGYGKLELDPNIPPPLNGGLDSGFKLNPGKIIYSKDLIFKGGSHSSTLSIIPPDKAKEMAGKLPEIPESPSDHFMNFLLAVKGNEKTRSPFEIAAPLSQVFCLGVIAQKLNVKLEFDRQRKKIVNHKLANQMLKGTPPRKDWEEFYKL
ncbi:Gfo/Idh/MocA family oxidoreductase [Saccharicrinis sp. FJH62]|uniref:Gfo/Idh/MocA family oxidoreductase n=1 Tax=Saccharicrinis sp. FJH62 TaxID=3344657 RepID=UPI0035D51119